MFPLPEPIKHQAIFKNEVWEVFYALGVKSILIPFPYDTSENYRLIPSPNTKYSFFDTSKDVVSWLISEELIKRGEERRSVNIIERPIWYELTEKGQNAYDELSPLENFKNEFVKRFRPICKV